MRALDQSKVACGEADPLRALLALHAIALGSLTQGVCLFDAEYRVDQVTERSVTFTYLPLNHKQVLDIPAVN